MPLTRILYGGSFDPPQIAHRKVIDAALGARPDAELLVLPSGHPPHKQGSSPFVLRLRLCELAFASIPRVRVSDEERDEEPSFTFQTLERQRRELPGDAKLCFLLGSDSLLDLPNWRYPERILAQAELLTVVRPGFDPAQILELPAFEGWPKEALLQSVLPGLAPPISSTEVRRRLGQGEDCHEFLDPAVRNEILGSGLYREGDSRPC